MEACQRCVRKRRHFCEVRSRTCSACPNRSQCTKSKTTGRELSLRPKEQYLALQAARERQKTREFRTEYGVRAGIEGTLSQGVRSCGLRRSRYIGEAKTHLQNLAIAAALNLIRMVNWLMDIPIARTRRSALVRLALQKGLIAPLPA